MTRGYKFSELRKLGLTHTQLQRLRDFGVIVKQTGHGKSKYRFDLDSKTVLTPELLQELAAAAHAAKLLDGSEGAWEGHEVLVDPTGQSPGSVKTIAEALAAIPAQWSDGARIMLPAGKYKI